MTSSSPKLNQAQLAALAQGRPVALGDTPLDQAQSITIDAVRIVAGTLLYHMPTSTPFRVLCNCPNSQPRHHVLRHVRLHPGEYRYLTTDEVQAFAATARVALQQTPATPTGEQLFAAAVTQANLQAAPGAGTVAPAEPLPHQDPAP